jgi:hypothetical protein
VGGKKHVEEEERTKKEERGIWFVRAARVKSVGAAMEHGTGKHAFKTFLLETYDIKSCRRVCGRVQINTLKARTT